MHEIFFIDYHLVENKLKELTCLCFLKDINMNCSNLEEVVNSLRYGTDTSDCHSSPLVSLEFLCASVISYLIQGEAGRRSGC